MNKPLDTSLPVAKTLAEQKSDFTAEGSPPPGKVSTSMPLAESTPAKTSPPARPGRRTLKLKRAATPAIPPSNR
jgi:hypothetical protein